MRTRCLTVLLASTAALPAIAFQAQPSQPTVTPVADHHVHLRSPAMTELFGAQIPAVALPQDLRSLLRDFETNWRARDAAALASLFAPNGVMQVGRDWKRGPAGIHLALLGRGGGIRFHTQTFGAGTTHGYTVYLSQTLICIALFYGIGLGFGGQVGPTLFLPIAVAIFAAQVLMSVVWLRQFRFGPVEWLWRSLTYGRRELLARRNA